MHHTPNFVIPYIRPEGHAAACRRRLAAAWQLLRVTARRTYVFNFFNILSFLTSSRNGYGYGYMNE